MNVAIGLAMTIVLYAVLLRLDHWFPFFKRPWAAWTAIASYFGICVALGAALHAS